MILPACLPRTGIACVILCLALCSTEIVAQQTLEIKGEVFIGSPYAGPAGQGIVDTGSEIVTSTGIMSGGSLYRFDSSWNYQTSSSVSYTGDDGIEHIGDLAYDDAYVYAPLNDSFSGAPANLQHIVWFDPETLDYVDHEPVSFLSDGESAGLAGLAWNGDYLYGIEWRPVGSSTNTRLFEFEMLGAVPQLRSTWELSSLAANGIAFLGDYLFVSWGESASEGYLDVYRFNDLSVAGTNMPFHFYSHAIKTDWWWWLDELLEWRHEEGLTFRDGQLWLGQWDYAVWVETAAAPTVSGFNATPDTNTNIFVTFTQYMDGSTLTNTTISVLGSASGIHSCTFSYNDASRELMIDPQSDFSHDETVTVTIGTGARDLTGHAFESSYGFDFTIGSVPIYFISAQAGDNGSVTPSGIVWVNSGDDVTFTATPDSGYAVDKWYVGGIVFQVGGSTYELQNVQASHSLLVTFEPEEYSEITVLSPNGGEIYGQRNRMRITWESIGSTGSDVKIELLKGGSLNTVIAASANNSGWYSWTVPDAQALGTDYRVRISSLSSPASDDSDADFEITVYIPPPQTVYIYNANDLQAMCSDAAHPRDGHYVLMNDIDVSGVSNWDPIGSDYQHYFRGELDGRGYKITGLTIDRPGESHIGLFSVLMDSAVVKNLSIEDYGGIYGYGYVGILAGECAGTIINCHAVIDDLEGKGGSRIGGLVGENTGTGLIRNCSVHISGDIEVEGSPNSVGGIAGLNAGNIEWCWADGTIDAWSTSSGKYGDEVGGLVGANYGAILACYSACQWVQGEDWTGGLVGLQADGTIADCYYSGQMADGDVGVGGIAGKTDGGLIERCYVTGGVDGNTYEGRLVGDHSGTIVDSFYTGSPAVGDPGGAVTNCHSKTTEEMKQEATFTTVHGANWDFDNVWTIDEGVSYPELRGIGPQLSPPTGVSASTGESNGVHISWVSPPDALAYRVYRADSNDPDAPKTALGDGWQAGIGFVDATASPEVDYYYCVKAAATINGARESEFSTYSGAGSRTYPPLSAPGNVVASDDLAGLVSITWDPAPNASHYRVYRSDSEAAPKTAIGSWQVDLSFADTPPNPDTPYYYWVTAAIDVTGGRESDFGGPDTGQYFVPDVTPPLVAVSASPELPIETQSIDLLVSASDDDNLDVVILHWDDGTEHTHSWESIASDTLEASHNIGAYAEGNTVTYWAEAWDTTGNRAESEHRAFVVQPESVSTPDRPDGELTRRVGRSGTYVSGGASTDLADPVEYQFDWGNSVLSEWGLPTQSYSWPTEGLYSVRARARCQVHNNRESDWSSSLLVVVNPDSVPGDFDHDNDVDQQDFGHLQICFSGSDAPQNNPACYDARLDGDDDVDNDDLGLFEGCVSGPTVPADPACADALPLTVNATADDISINEGQCTTLRGSATGGTVPYTYDWSAPGWGGSTEQNPQVCPTETITYTLVVTDSSNPAQQDADTVIVVVVPQLVADAGGDVTINEGECTTLQGSATDGTQPYSYDWFAPSWAGSTEQNPQVCPTETTTYTLTVTDASSPQQSDDDTVTVTVQPPLPVEMEWVTVGDPGNAPDDTGYGAVGYVYKIGKYEVTNDQYAEFLNAVATVGDLNGLYNTNMGDGWNSIGGISRTGSGTVGDPWVYSAQMNRGNRPVNYVSWYDALRFANWLHNGQPNGGQDASTTEDGSYNMTQDFSGPDSPIRNPNASWVLPSEDEWYKAAYYKGGGTAAGYWDYATQSDTVPRAEAPPGTDVINGSANYYSGGYVDPMYYTTEVGAYTAKPSDSAYGTFDQGGNAWEWNEADIYGDGSCRGLRGGAFNLDEDRLHAEGRDYGYTIPTIEAYHVGFRVAEIPEPATVNMEFVTVGNAGNANDIHGDGYGAVDYVYKIGKYEVTNSQCCEFLNAVAATDTNNLYNAGMGGGYGGITRSGSSGSYTYSTIAARGNMPVNWVSWYDTLRFANWLHNGQPTGAQDATTTEDGAYDMAYVEANPLATDIRKTGALVFLPSEDEWYKSAYYDPNKDGLGIPGYWDYPTKQDDPNPPTPGVEANFDNAGGDLTDVGNYPFPSSYGTFDQGGNVWEWNEAVIGSYRGRRGAGFSNVANSLRASDRADYNPTNESGFLGFRVASLPD